MAVKTTWPVRHRCGHHIDWDLSKKPPSKRATFARWLAQRDCTRCWWAKRRTRNSHDRTAIGVQHGPYQVVELRAWESQVRMPALVGSDKAVAWARAIRHRLLSAAYEHHLRNGCLGIEAFAVHFEEPGRIITSAAWWIDQSDTDPIDTEARLADVTANRSTGADTSTRAVSARRGVAGLVETRPAARKVAEARERE